jgi:hypothetical protein
MLGKLEGIIKDYLCLRFFLLIFLWWVVTGFPVVALLAYEPTYLKVETTDRNKETYEQIR